MKRTTIFVEPDVERELQALARRKKQPVAALVREALAEYVAGARRERQPRLGFIAAGRSGHRDTAERHEDLLFAPAPAPDAPPPAKRRAAPRARRVRGS